MPSGRNGRRRYGLALLLGCYAVGGGLVARAGANPPPAGADEVVATSRPGGLKQVSADGPRLAPRSSFRWSVASLDRQDSLHGTAIVGPDGTAEFGPYGSVHVAGMTLPEARDAVERRLSQILRQPRVALDAADAVPAVEWRASGEPRLLQQAQPAAQPQPQPQPQGSQFAVSRPQDNAMRNDGGLRPVANNWQPNNRAGLLQRASGGTPEQAPPPAVIN